jgi:hypothetical protein
MPRAEQVVLERGSPSLRRYAGTLVLTTLFLLLWCREYESPDGLASVLYDKALGGVRWIDLALLSLIFLHVILFFYSGKKWFRVPRRISRPSWVFLALVAFAFTYGWRMGGEHLFFDWRELFLGAGLTIVFSYWVRTSAELKLAVRTFAVVFGLRIAFILGSYLAGGGIDSVLEGIRTPLYDGATLSGAGFVAVLGLNYFLDDVSFADRTFWVVCAFLGYLLVFASFRRTFWGEVFVSTFIVLVTRPRARLKMIGAVLIPAMVVIMVAGPFVYKRLVSFDVMTNTMEYGDTNLGHINDILDAMDHVREHPILGIGLGRPYQTRRIVEWKTESSLVHNALVHVWLFYGLAGLITYVWFHISVFRWLRSYRFNTDPVFRTFAATALAYVIAQFVMAAAFSPWPYGQLQNTIVLAFVFGSLFARAPRRKASVELKPSYALAA